MAFKSFLRLQAYMGFKEDFDVPSEAANIPRFLMLVVGMFCSVAISAANSFSLISTQLRDDYHFTQNQITTISTFGMCVGYLTLPFGLIYDYIGPKPIYVIAIVMIVVGTNLFALLFEGSIEATVWGAAAINATITLGCSLLDMAGLLTVLSWFPLDRGFVIACMKTGIGLGGAIVATIYDTYLGGSNEPYMYFLMSYSLVCGLIALVIVYLPPYHMTGSRIKNYNEDTNRRAAAYQSVYMRYKAPIKRFTIALTFLIGTLIVVSVRNIVFVYVDATQAQKNPPAIIMISLYLLLFTTLIPWKWLDVQPGSYDRANRELAEQHTTDAYSEAQCGSNHDTLDAEPTAERAGDERSVPSDDTDCGDLADEPTSARQCRRAIALAIEEEKIAPQYQTSFWYNLRRPTLWGMWIVGFCSFGIAFTVSMNIAEIYLAIDGNPDNKQGAALYLAIIGIGSSVGRILISFTEVYTQSKPAGERIPITVFYVVPPAFEALGALLFLFVPTNAMIIPVLLCGLGNGFYAAGEVIVCRTIFSIDISKHFNSLYIFEMLSLIFLNRLLFGEIMTKSSVIINEVPRCLERDKCIRTTFITLTCIGLVGVAAGVMVHLAYRSFSISECEKRAERRAHLEELLSTLETCEKADTQKGLAEP